jgi:hypothetical protein
MRASIPQKPHLYLVARLLQRAERLRDDWLALLPAKHIFPHSLSTARLDLFALLVCSARGEFQSQDEPYIPVFKDYTPISAAVLPAELQVSSAYDLSDPSTYSSYFVYDACPIEIV